ncbi:response regulator receiver protein [Streptomyces hygroscopicus]|uniref:ATP-binding protein n=1 Tax=Streptomyces hygroscopicus TaxID=1912 RepID=UPI002240930A|nr:ATP-binding protein [Streptomyces hygroscopicus]MCW7941273.1 response regulator receiver protein [Streptomyces hygroscopicus]
MTIAQLVTAPRDGVEHVFPLPHDPRAVPAVRRRVRAVLTTWNLSEDVVQDVLVVVSELVTNAVIHALPPAALRLSQSLAEGRRAVHVEVSDAGPAAPAGLSALSVDPDEHGRGIDIVRTLSARCGVRAHCGRTSRWAEVLAG